MKEHGPNGNISDLIQEVSALNVARTLTVSIDSLHCLSPRKFWDSALNWAMTMSLHIHSHRRILGPVYDNEKEN
jgi:hypothetical protein